MLAYELAGARSAIFVGALNKNGALLNKASLASYSNHAGSGGVNGGFIHNQFVVVGVDAASTGAAGTSFAAPIVSGYAAILGSKFRSATPMQITNQLLRTARTDTMRGVRPVHSWAGRSEPFTNACALFDASLRHFPSMWIPVERKKCRKTRS